MSGLRRGSTGATANSRNGIRRIVYVTAFIPTSSWWAEPGGALLADLTREVVREGSSGSVQELVEDMAISD